MKRGVEKTPIYSKRGFLLSRSGVTQMGLDLAKKVGVTLIARAKGKHFLVYTDYNNIEYDAIPVMRKMVKEK